MAAIRATQDFKFRPSRCSCLWLLGGNVQNLLVELKESWHDYVGRGFTYDKREVFSLSDGGEIHIDFKGDSFINEEAQKRPIVFIVPGLTSCSTNSYVVDTTK